MVCSHQRRKLDVKKQYLVLGTYDHHDFRREKSDTSKNTVETRTCVVCRTVKICENKAAMASAAQTISSILVNEVSTLMLVRRST